MISIPRILLATLLTVHCAVASAKDYSHYHVIHTTALDMFAGPANTAVLLSPDGNRLLQVGADICLHMLSAADTWNKAGCIKNMQTLKIRGAEDLLWSPRGDQLVMPTFDGVQTFRDTDIRVLDLKTLTATNLTDDGLDGGVFHNQTPGMFDIIARWIDADTIAFLRYPVPTGGIGKGGPPSIMTIDAAGGEPTELLKIAGADQLAVTVLAVSADGRRIAYSFDDKGKPEIAGIFVLEIGSNEPGRVAPMAAAGQPPAGLAFSADGDFLLLLTPGNAGLDARVLELATGKIVPVDTTRTISGVAWSPTGSALAYVTDDRDKPGASSGLFLAGRPGAPGRQLLEQPLMSPVCCWRLPFTWAANDTMVLGNVAKMDAPLFVRLGE
jgi:WD40 repeat protein